MLSRSMSFESQMGLCVQEKIGKHQNILLKWSNCIAVVDQTAWMRILISLASCNQ